MFDLSGVSFCLILLFCIIFMCDALCFIFILCWILCVGFFVLCSLCLILFVAAEHCLPPCRFKTGRQKSDRRFFSRYVRVDQMHCMHHDIGAR